MISLWGLSSIAQKQSLQPEELSWNGYAEQLRLTFISRNKKSASSTIHIAIYTWISGYGESKRPAVDWMDFSKYKE